MELVEDIWPAAGSLKDLLRSCLSSELTLILLMFLLGVVDGFRSVRMIKASFCFLSSVVSKHSDFVQSDIHFGRVIKLCVFIFVVISSMLGM